MATCGTEVGKKTDAQQKHHCKRSVNKTVTGHLELQSIINDDSFYSEGFIFVNLSWEKRFKNLGYHHNGLSGNLQAGAAGATLLHIFSGLHKAKVNPEARNFFWPLQLEWICAILSFSTQIILYINGPVNIFKYRISWGTRLLKLTTDEVPQKTRDLSIVSVCGKLFTLTIQV